MPGLLQPEAARNVTVEGRVQGVGFRWSALEEARRLGLTGWVRNADDGSVEIHAEGSLTSLDAYVSWLRKGPPGARVDALRSRSAAPSGLYLRFSIEH